MVACLYWCMLMAMLMKQVKAIIPANLGSVLDLQLFDTETLCQHAAGGVWSVMDTKTSCSTVLRQVLLRLTNIVAVAVCDGELLQVVNFKRFVRRRVARGPQGGNACWTWSPQRCTSGYRCSSAARLRLTTWRAFSRMLDSASSSAVTSRMQDIGMGGSVASSGCLIRNGVAFNLSSRPPCYLGSIPLPLPLKHRAVPILFVRAAYFAELRLPSLCGNRPSACFWFCHPHDDCCEVDKYCAVVEKR